MSGLEKILETTLGKAGALEPVTLGKSELFSFNDKDKRQLISQLGETSKFNNGMIIVIIILHIVLFATAVFLVFYFLSDPKVITYLLGGSVFSIMVLIYSLIHVLKLKFANDFIRATLPYLPPEQAMIVIQSTYFRLRNRKSL
jgi:hypothetical protein